jgi:peroxiredoxin
MKPAYFLEFRFHSAFAVSQLLLFCFRMISFVESILVRQLKQSKNVNGGTTIGRGIFVKISKLHKRMISVGTDLTKSTTTWQQARPWHTEEGLSNLAKDNARTMSDLFKGKKVAVFGIPAPFTGVCTNAHYPPYKALADDFKKKGVDSIICYSVACPYAHFNWAKGMGNNFSKISFLADVDATFAKEFKLDRDYSAVSLGVRAERFSMFVDDGIVKSFQEVKDASKDAEVLLGQVE